ncbi:MAG: hypothetical protein M1816_007157 [Peltula sp. TS41687]|nr:MAG: hypothetical protein M1816_007157 [Peltula sp. TS41687]
MPNLFNSFSDYLAGSLRESTEQLPTKISGGSDETNGSPEEKGTDDGNTDDGGTGGEDAGDENADDEANDDDSTEDESTDDESSTEDGSTSSDDADSRIVHHVRNERLRAGQTIRLFEENFMFWTDKSIGKPHSPLHAMYNPLDDNMWPSDGPRQAPKSQLPTIHDSSDDSRICF